VTEHRILARPSHFRNGFQRVLAVFALGAFVIGSSWRVGADDEEVAAGGQALMAGARRQDRDITGLQCGNAASMSMS
jgi:hypothetical protein